jgi:hypothetical protein
VIEPTPVYLGCGCRAEEHEIDALERDPEARMWCRRHRRYERLEDAGDDLPRSDARDPIDALEAFR